MRAGPLGPVLVYRRGWNPAALAAVVPATLVALPLAFVPGLGQAKDFSLFVGSAVAAMLYAALSLPARMRPRGAPEKPEPRR